PEIALLVELDKAEPVNILPGSDRGGRYCGLDRRLAQVIGLVRRATGQHESERRAKQPGCAPNECDRAHQDVPARLVRGLWFHSRVPPVKLDGPASVLIRYSLGKFACAGRSG